MKASICKTYFEIFLDSHFLYFWTTFLFCNISFFVSQWKNFYAKNITSFFNQFFCILNINILSHGFLHHSMAQLEKHQAPNQRIVSSNPSWDKFFILCVFCIQTSSYWNYHWAVPFYIHTGGWTNFTKGYSEIDFQGLLGNFSDISRGFCWICSFSKGLDDHASSSYISFFQGVG